MLKVRFKTVVAAVFALLGWGSQASHADLTFSLTWGWPAEGTPDARRDAAWWALTNILGRFNAYGDFTAGNDGNVEAAYSVGTPTADAGYNGQIRYGGTWPNDRVTMHELNHWLGSGTWGHAYGTRAAAILEQFDGVGARFGTDGTHFWPYGLNYDNEWNEIAAQRNVAIMYAARADWGIGLTSNPKAWNATSVTLTGSDAAGQSGFNYGSKWSDNTFAHSNANYATGAFDVRTPNGYPSWTFAGKSLTVNQGGRLLYNSWGHDGRITFKNLILDNGTVRQDQNDGNTSTQLDTFRLAGNVSLVNNGTFQAAEGDIYVEASVRGNGSLTKTGSYTVTLQAANTYAGATNIHQGILRLAPTRLIADYTFDNVSGTAVVNGGSGGAGMNGTLTNGATIVPGGRFGNAVQLANGASVDIASGVTDLGTDASWAVSAWIKTTTAGATILTKGDGAWAYGNTIFYLGDGNEGGSGNQPAGVRWAGGFLNAAAGSGSVADGTWHQVTYVNTGGTYTIYVDGQARTIAANNAAFGVPDVGSLIKLGRSMSPGDGAVNFNGLMDSVQFHGQSLSAAQVAALYAGKKLGVLPSTTVVNIANGATLELAGTAQEVAGLNGVAGSRVFLGNGELIVNATSDSTFSGFITNSGLITKTGTGTLTLNGTNSYVGVTTVKDGALVVGESARNPILGNGAGADIQKGKLSFTYAGGASPAETVIAILDAGYEQAAKFSSGKLRSTTLAAGQLLGWIDNGLAVTVAPTLPGDANLDFAVSFADLVALAQNYDTMGNVWAEGDFNYDAAVDFADLVALAQNYNQGVTAAESVQLGESFAAQFARAQSLVPEPTMLGVLACASLLPPRRNRALRC